MKNLEKITKAESLTKELSNLMEGHKRLSQPGAHINVCNHNDQSLPSVPLDDSLKNDIIKLIEDKIDEKWLELKEVCDEEAGDEPDPKPETQTGTVCTGGGVISCEDDF